MILNTDLTLTVLVAPIISLDFLRLLFMANGGETQTVCGLNLQKAQRGPDNDDTDLPLITARDVNACNGIIHVIDEVMLHNQLQGVRVNHRRLRHYLLVLLLLETRMRAAES